MDLLTRPQGISLPLAPVMSGAIGLAVAIVVGALPAALLEGLVSASGLPALLAAAEPPLGLTARVLITVTLALVIAASAQVPLGWYFGRRSLRVRPLRPARVAVRNAPAPAKPRPIAANEELGAPFLSVAAPAPKPPTTTANPASPQRVTDMVELVGGVYIPDRRRRPRHPRFRDPVFDAEPTVSNLLKRLEVAIATEQLGPLGRRPLDPGFREAVERLNGLRKAG